MLLDYVKNDDKYRSYAYKICGCHELKNDMVNDMYIKLDAILKREPEKKISTRYIFLMLKSIFFDIKRATREIPVAYIPESMAYPQTDILSERSEMDGVLSEMPFFDREILLKSQEKSFRKIGNQINCHHTTISKMYNLSLKKAKKICLEKGLRPNR